MALLFNNLMIKNLPLQKEHSFLIIIISLLSIIAYFFDAQISSIFVYQHDLITQGQLWRLLSGHFFHTNGVHLLLNLSGLLLLWALHGHFYTIKNYSLLFLSSAIICSLGLYFLSPNIQQYVGLSGVLHGIFVFGAIKDIADNDKTGYFLFIGVWLKVAHEQYYGASQDVASLIEANVAIDAHLWGAVGGLLFSCAYLLYKKQLKKIQYK